ncbi:MAG: hypothetical protein H7X95_14775, partial [Deltaproteobacteria bacterium]|nr:hypothetical protein [Deltaproteobacteria bacterium]
MTRRLKFALTALMSLGLLGTSSAATAAVSHPLEIINRPRTLPAGQLELRGGIDLSRSSSTSPTGVRQSQTSLFAPLGIGYGISNDFDVYLFYG